MSFAKKSIKMQLFSHNVLIHLSKLLGQRSNVRHGTTFNLSYHIINSDFKSQSYAHLIVFNKLVSKPRWPPKFPPKRIQTQILMCLILCESFMTKAFWSSFLLRWRLIIIAPHKSMEIKKILTSSEVKLKHAAGIFIPA